MRQQPGGEVHMTVASVAALRAWARAANPIEACGLLSGRLPGTAQMACWTVEQAHSMTNVAARPATSFRLDPVEVLRVTRTVETTGLEIVGVYHSHPGGLAVPSATDVEAAALMPKGWCHLLVGGDEGDGEGRDTPVRAWLLGSSSALELELQVSARGRPPRR